MVHPERRLTGDALQRLMIDKEGSIWSSSNGGGVDRFRDGKFVTYSSRIGLSSDLANAVFEDKSGALWIGTAGGGLNRLKDVSSQYSTQGTAFPETSSGTLQKTPKGTFGSAQTKEFVPTKTAHSPCGWIQEARFRGGDERPRA